MAYNNYGVNRAKARAKNKAEQTVNEKPESLKKTKKEIKAPSLEWDPMSNKKIKLPQHPIQWNDSETNRHSDYLIDKLKDNLMQVVAMPAGTGKTAVSISTLGKMQELQKKPMKFIITAPSKVVEGMGWQNTIKSWNDAHPDNQLNPILVTTTDKFASAIQHAPTLAIIYNMLDEDGILILDEWHKYKNPVSKRAKQLQKLADMKKIGLSATPLTNDLVLDAASILIAAGYYRNKSHFEEKAGLTYLKGRFNEYLVYKNDGAVNVSAWPYYNTVLDQLAEVIYRPSVDLTNIGMPDVKTKVIALDHSESLTNDMRSLAYAHKQRMFDSYTDYFMEVVERLHNDEVRLDKLVELVQQKDVKQPLIFYINNVVRDTIIERFEKENIKNYQTVNADSDFGDLDHSSEGPVLIQYYSGAEGIELKNSNTTIYYQNQHSYAILEQARGRNVRRGMKHLVNQYHLIADNPIDQHVFDVAMNREAGSKMTLEDVYRIALEKL